MFKAPKGTGMKAAPIEPGNYLARLVRVIDMGVTENRAYKGEVKPPTHKISVTYELSSEFMKDAEGNDDTEKPRWISEIFAFYPPDADRSTCAKRYLAFDPTNKLGGDWEKILGSACTLTIVPKAKGDGTKVGAVSPPMKGMAVPPLVNTPVLFTLDNPDLEFFESLPDFLRTEILNGVGEGNILLRDRLNGIGNPDEDEPEMEDNPY